MIGELWMGKREMGHQDEDENNGENTSGYE
jgi:hypothetical protein